MLISRNADMISRLDVFEWSRITFTNDVGTYICVKNRQTEKREQHVLSIFLHVEFEPTAGGLIFSVPLGRPLQRSFYFIYFLSVFLVKKTCQALPVAKAVL